MITFLQDSTATGVGETTAYDSVWAHTSVPVQQPTGIEQVMLSEDKLYVVLAVVLIIWFGIVYFLFRTDRKIAQLERSVENGIPVEHPDRI